MATLLIDLGNTRLKWAWLKDGELFEHDSAIHQGQPLANGLSSLLQLRPERLLINSVLGVDQQQQIQQHAEQLGLSPLWATSESSFGDLRNGYKQPAQLGSDRWLAMIAAQQLYPGRPLCVVSCGTAVTIDAVSPDGQHLGGMILPGLRLMQQSLKQGTQQVDVQLETESREMFANNTSQAVDAGCHFAISGAITQMLAKLSVEYGKKVKCILSGGDAAAIIPLLQTAEIEHRPNLVLEGLALWGEQK